MELSKQFEDLICFVRTQVLPKSFAQKLERDLEFFLEAAIKTPDRKPGTDFVKFRWLQFLNTLRNTRVFDQLRDRAYDWAAIENFVGDNVNAKPIRILPPPPQEPKELTWEAEKLFSHLLNAALKLEEPKGSDRLALLLGLKYLLTESEKPKPRRDQKWIASTWNSLHPMLKHLGLLAPFENQPNLKQRLRTFVRGTL